MAKDGKKLELYEILAAKRAKGKVPLGLNASAKQANVPDQDPGLTDRPGLIIDDAVQPELAQRDERKIQRETVNIPPPASGKKMAGIPRPRGMEPEAPQRETGVPMETGRRGRTHAAPEGSAKSQAVPVPDYVEPEPRARSPREVVFALDTALIFFTVILALIGCSYFIGYKRGQEEKPAGLAGADIEAADPSRITFRNLSREPRSVMLPPEQDYTLIIRTEPAGDNDLPERLELELAEALARGRREVGWEIPGFIFRTPTADPQYILAVGLGGSANDENLNRLLTVFNKMDGVTLSRMSNPYRGCRVAPVRELGTPVY